MKLLVDMNLSPRWVTLLTGAGIVAEHYLHAWDVVDLARLT
jgi:predicted nuclease of predicted toxin-antitoxin system